MRPIPSFVKSKRAERMPARRILTGGVALCVACNGNGTLELQPQKIGEHSVRGVRADLAAGHLKLCDCEAGDFWRTMLEEGLHDR